MNASNLIERENVCQAREPLAYCPQILAFVAGGAIGANHFGQRFLSQPAAG